MRSTGPTRHPPNGERRRFFRVRSAPRASQACLSCAAAKTRCDNDPTCGRCRRKNLRCTRGVRLPNDLLGLNGLAYDGYVYETAGSRYHSHGPRSAQTNHEDAQSNTEANPEDILARPQLEQTIDTTLTDLNSLQSNWDSGISTQLFDLGSDIDWTLNIPDYDGSSVQQVSPLYRTAQVDDNILPPDNSSLAGTVDPEGSNCACQAFRQSIGQWNPDARHYRGVEEQEMSSGDMANLRADMLGRADPSISKEPLSTLARDRLIAMALVTCEPGNIPVVLSAFPAVEVLDRLINISLTAQKDQVEGFIHVPTFSKAECRPDTLAAIITDGADKSQCRAVKKFAFGLGEILKHHLYQAAERNIFLTRDLGYLQAFCLNLNLALWSGIRHKMELSGSIVGVILNMMRAAGRYRRTSYRPVIPLVADIGHVLEKKWRTWVEQESFKRMVYYIHIHCVQGEFMTSTAESHISSSELSLPLPESKELWLARSATDWKEVYLRLQSQHPHRAPPSVLECVVDPAKTIDLPEIYDYEFIHLVQVYSISALVREFKQSQSIFSLKEANVSRETVIADEIQEKRLMHILDTVRIGHETSESNQRAVFNMVRELASMHLHTFCDQIEVMAGREGPEEAQTAYPILYSWFHSQSSRQAVWHAGQVLRNLRSVAPSNLHIFHAVACYHASLCLWIYGIFSKLEIDDIQQPPTKASSARLGTTQLDGEETLGTRRWIVSNLGIPVISRNPLGADQSHEADSNRIPLNLTKECMDILIEVIRDKFHSNSRLVPLLVQNICHLMRAIGEIQQPCSNFTPAQSTLTSRG